MDPLLIGGVALSFMVAIAIVALLICCYWYYAVYNPADVTAAAEDTLEDTEDTEDTNDTEDTEDTPTLTPAQLYSDEIDVAYLSCNGTKPDTSYDITSILKTHLNNWENTDTSSTDNTILGGDSTTEDGSEIERKTKWWRELNVAIYSSVDIGDYNYIQPEERVIEGSQKAAHSCQTLSLIHI